MFAVLVMIAVLEGLMIWYLIADNVSAYRRLWKYEQAEREELCGPH